jgi:hypothetical protein
VYVIETPAPLKEAPLDNVAIAGWIRRVSTLRIDGHTPTAARLRDRLATFWIPMEAVVYVGLAGANVGLRVGQFYRTSLGDPRPHAGGHWLKVLAELDELLVWWAESDDPDRSEDVLLSTFSRQHNGLLPFANRQTAAGIRKAHGISGSVLSRESPRSGARPAALARERSRSSVASYRAGGRPDLRAINEALQMISCNEPERRASAVAAARELDRLGLLRDSQSRPGLPLRNLLREGKVANAYQEGGRWWFIRCAEE